VQEPQPQFSATPAMDEAEIFFYLTTGQRQARAQEQTASLGDALLDSGLSLAGSAFAGVAKNVLEKIVPVSLDVLSVETDLANQSGRVRAGKFVTDRLYIGGQVNQSLTPRPNENIYEFEAEWRLNESTSLR